MSATERAYSFAKERILDGRFAGGDLLKEGDVADDVGVSRTPVREAFLRLESDGLLQLLPKRGALVVPVSPDEVEHVIETRLLVERHAIETVIRRGPSLYHELGAAIERQELLLAPQNLPAFVEADREFHRIVVAAAGNPILLQLHDSLRDRQSRMGRTALMRDVDRPLRILEEHRGLAAAIADGQVERASNLLERHLEGTLALLRRSV